MDTLTHLIDKQQVADVLVRYTVALDTRDWPLLRTCFLPGAVADYEGLPTAHGCDAIEDTCRRSLERLTASQHLLGNVLVGLAGDRARSTCYVQAQHVRAGTVGGDHFIVAGTYHDELQRTAEGWRIAARRLQVQWTDGNPAVLGRSS